jgi:uncharacterized lipoprotein YajG
MSLSCRQVKGTSNMVWKLAFWLVLTLLLAGCQTFVTPIPPQPTLQLPSASTADPALFGTLEPVAQLPRPQTATPIPELIMSS